MYTSSSNECENSRYVLCWPDDSQSPWYPTLGQPFIYCAQIPPSRRSQQPNCFKKAFRWYTEEHIQPSSLKDSSSNVKHDIKGFAGWLDEKYTEYLRSNQNERFQTILSQSTFVDINKTSNNNRERPRTKKRRRFKSPWRRQKYSNSSDKGDVVIKSNQSIEVILKPQNLSRTASECCQRNKVQSCCHHSNSTVDSNITGQNVTISKSLTSVYKEKELCIVLMDVPENDNRKKAETTKGKTRRDRAIEVSCQCSKISNKKVDAFSQSDRRNTRKYTSNICDCNEDKAGINITQKTLLTSDSLTSVTMQKKILEILLRNPPETDVNIANFEKSKASFGVYVNNGSQTSDHPINLDHSMFQEYPFFMKIVCADKLKEN